MTTVYLVTDGSYSDYRVLGVYSTEEKAKSAVELFHAQNDIEEFEIDAIPEHPPGMLAWSVVMEANGDTRLVRRESPLEDRWAPYGDGRACIFYLWAKDEEHALKIANERRTSLIALGEWTTDWHAWLRKKDIARGFAGDAK